MTISSVQTTENGGYVAVIDGVTYALPPNGSDAYSQAVAAWIDAGGTPTPYVPPTAQELLERLRDAARAILDARQELGAILRAIVLETLGYENAGRAKYNTLLQWLGTQGTLTQRAQLTAMQLIEATPAQARNAIQARIEAGEADD